MKRITFTNHALDMLSERGFFKETIEDVISAPDWEQKTGSEIYFAFKRIENRVLRVVAKQINPEETKVITFYFDRRLGSS
jgi:hypothetical protein